MGKAWESRTKLFQCRTIAHPAIMKEEIPPLMHSKETPHSGNLLLQTPRAPNTDNQPQSDEAGSREEESANPR